MDEKWKLSKKELGATSCHSSTSSKSLFARSCSTKSPSSTSKSPFTRSSSTSSTKSPLLRSFSQKSSSSKNPSISRKCSSLAKEQKARFYIMRRCVAMLVCWHKHGDSWWGKRSLIACSLFLLPSLCEMGLWVLFQNSYKFSYVPSDQEEIGVMHIFLVFYFRFSQFVITIWYWATSFTYCKKRSIYEIDFNLIISQLILAIRVLILDVCMCFFGYLNQIQKRIVFSGDFFSPLGLVLGYRY